MMPKYRVVGVLRQRDAGDDRERYGQVHRGESEKDCLDMGDKRWDPPQGSHHDRDNGVLEDVRDCNIMGYTSRDVETKLLFVVWIMVSQSRIRIHM